MHTVKVKLGDVLLLRVLSILEGRFCSFSKYWKKMKQMLHLYAFLPSLLPSYLFLLLTLPSPLSPYLLPFLPNFLHHYAIIDMAYRPAVTWAKYF